jgi:hypothetical protein
VTLLRPGTTQGAALPQRHSALVRGDDGALHVRRFATGVDARSASAALELTPETVASIAGPTSGLMPSAVFARKLGIHPRTVRRLHARGALPGSVDHGARLLRVPAHLLRLAVVYGLRGVERMAAAGLLPNTGFSKPETGLKNRRAT